MTDLLSLSVLHKPANLANLSQAQIREAIVEQLLHNSQQHQQKMVGPNTPADIDDLFPLIQTVIQHQQSREGIKHPLSLTEEFPPTDYTKETITYRLTAREPATVSQQAPPFGGGVKNFKPLFRESYLDTSNPGYRILVFGLLFDNLFELTCWAQTNKQANHRASWLEHLMLTNTWFFRYKGINQIIYYGRGNDSLIEESSQRLMARPLTYYVRTEKLYTVSEKVIDEILFNITLSDNLS